MSAVLVILCTFVAFFAVTGWRLVPVLSGSMRPLLQPGDLVAAKPQRAGLLLVGQTVIYTAPIEGRPVIVHRVLQVSRSGNDVIFRTKGDANNAQDEWTASIPATGKILIYEGNLPRMGRLGVTLSAATSGRTTPLVAVCLLTLLLLGMVWRPERPEPEDAVAELPAQRSGTARDVLSRT